MLLYPSVSDPPPLVPDCESPHLIIAVGPASEHWTFAP